MAEIDGMYAELEYAKVEQYRLQFRQRHLPTQPELVAFSLDQHCNSLEACKNHLETFNTQKYANTWEDSIMKLPQRWRKLVRQQMVEYIYVHMTKYFIETFTLKTMLTFLPI